MPDLYDQYFYGDDIFSFFSRAFDAYYKGGWVVVDFILWYLIFYEVMVKAYARAFKLSYGNEGGSTKLSKAVAAILAVSMVLLEQVAGFNMLMVSPLAALVACVVFWMGIYYFFKGKAERDSEETHTPWLLIATGIIPAMIFFALMKKLSESAASGTLPVSAAFVRPLGMTMSMINFGLQMLVLAGTILLLMWLFSKMRGWFGISSADAGKDSERAFEGAKHSFEEAARTMTEKVMEKLNIMDTKLDDIKKGVDAIAGMLKTFVDTWKGEVAGLLTSAKAELSSAMTDAEGRVKTAIDTATKPILDKLNEELPKIERWVNNARDSLLNSMNHLIDKAKNEVLGKTSEVLAAIGNVTTELNKVGERLEKAEDSLKKLVKKRAGKPADVAKINDILSKIDALKSDVNVQSESLTDHKNKEEERHNQVKTLLESLNTNSTISDFDSKITDLRKALETAIMAIPKGVTVNVPINFGTVVSQIGDVEQKGITLISSAQNAEEMIKRLEQVCGGEAGLSDAIKAVINDAIKTAEAGAKAVNEAEVAALAEIEEVKTGEAAETVERGAAVALLEAVTRLRAQVIEAQKETKTLVTALSNMNSNNVEKLWSTLPKQVLLARAEWQDVIRLNNIAATTVTGFLNASKQEKVRVVQDMWNTINSSIQTSISNLEGLNKVTDKVTVIGEAMRSAQNTTNLTTKATRLENLSKSIQSKFGLTELSVLCGQRYSEKLDAIIAVLK